VLEATGDLEPEEEVDESRIVELGDEDDSE